MNYTFKRGSMTYNPELMQVESHNKRGAIHVNVKHYETPSKYDEAITIICMHIDSAIAISKSNGKNKIHVVADFSDIDNAKFNCVFITKLFLHLKKQYIDIVKSIEIHNLKNKYVHAWNIIEPFLDAKTKKRVHIVKEVSE